MSQLIEYVIQLSLCFRFSVIGCKFMLYEKLQVQGTSPAIISTSDRFRSRGAIRLNSALAIYAALEMTAVASVAFASATAFHSFVSKRFQLQVASISSASTHRDARLPSVNCLS